MNAASNASNVDTEVAAPSYSSAACHTGPTWLWPTVLAGGIAIDCSKTYGQLPRQAKVMAYSILAEVEQLLVEQGAPKTVTPFLQYDKASTSIFLVATGVSPATLKLAVELAGYSTETRVLACRGF